MALKYKPREVIWTTPDSAGVAKNILLHGKFMDLKVYKIFKYLDFL